MQWEVVKTSPGLEVRFFCYVLLHKIRYGVEMCAFNACANSNSGFSNIDFCTWEEFNAFSQSETHKAELL